MNQHTKYWWKSKALWTAAIGLLLVIAQTFGVEVPVQIYAVLASFGIVFARVGSKKIATG